MFFVVTKLSLDILSNLIIAPYITFLQNADSQSRVGQNAALLGAVVGAAVLLGGVETAKAKSTVDWDSVRKVVRENCAWKPQSFKKKAAKYRKRGY